MDFSNGFIEDDNPVIPSGPAFAAPSSSSTPIVSSGRADILDLTEDSPPPQQISKQPSHYTVIPKAAQNEALKRFLAGGESLGGGGEASAKSQAGLVGTPGLAQYSLNGAGGGMGSGTALAGSGGFIRQRGLSAGQGGAFSPKPVAGPSSPSAARQLTGGAVHQHPLAPSPSTSSTSFGRIPVISSASSARIASQHLPSASTSHQTSGPLPPPPGGFSTAKNYYQGESAAARQARAAADAAASSARAGAGSSSAYQVASPSPGFASFASSSSGSFSASLDKGKSRAAPPPAAPPTATGSSVIDITSEPESDPDEIIVDDTPFCIGTLHTQALICDPFYPIIPPRPVTTHRLDGTLLNEEELAAEEARFARQKAMYESGPCPVHLHYEGLTLSGREEHQMLRLYVDHPEQQLGRPMQFGFVDYKVADMLAPLLGFGWHGTGITTGGHGKVYCEASVERLGERQPCFMKLKLTLFARPFDVHPVQEAIERVEPPLFLHDPSDPPQSHYSGYKYSNPHNPAKGVGADGDRRRQRLQNGMMSGMGGLGMQKAMKQVDYQRDQVKAVMEETKSGTDLEQVDPPAIVSTPLYPHQKQALSFLLDREAVVQIPPNLPRGEPEPIVSLWQRERNSYGKVVGWTCLVADVKIKGERPPPQARGAILADDMGLGKTIVVISLVCTTLPEALEWSKRPVTSERFDERFDETLNANDLSSAGRSVGLGEFGGHVWGLGGQAGTSSADILGVNGAGGGSWGKGGKPLSKKAANKQKKEKERAELDRLRFERLECRSRATLIVCPLSTVQNWESQFEEHTRVVEGGVEEDGEGGKVFKFGCDGVREERKKSVRVGKKRAKVEDSEEEESAANGGVSGATSATASADEDPSDSSMRGSEEEEDVKPKRKSSSMSKPKKKKSALSIYIYHGNARLADPRKLADHDVVITTFSTLGSEYSKQVRAEEEREDDEERAQKKRKEEASGIMEVFGFAPDGSVRTEPPGLQGDEEEKAKKPKRKRKRVEGNGVSPLQAVQWFRVVLDEAHIIKEHKTIQARAACDLSTQRRIALSGTPLQNSLNDIFSLLKFIRLVPFTERHTWTHHIGSLAQKGDELGTERLKLIMRHIALRRTKDTKDSNGKPILSLPPIDNKLISLQFSEKERAFYASRHTRYKHDFAKLEETDSVMKNFCSILQELLKLRQICVHPALLQDSEDRAGGDNLGEIIAAHGISKPRAIQLIALLRDAQSGDCAECGNSMAAFGRANVEELGLEEDGDGKKGKKPAAKKRRTNKTQTAATSSGVKLEDESGADSTGATDEVSTCVVTRCQHLFCRGCFTNFMCPSWPNPSSEQKTLCKVCSIEFLPALDAVEVEAREFQKALERSADERPDELDGKKGRKREDKKPKTRLFEHSTKTRALLLDLLPFSQVNPASRNFDPSFDPASLLSPDGSGGTIGFQPVRGEIVKSVVFSQWTTLLDRLGDALSQEQVKYGRLDGSMDREKRNAAMEAFKSDPSTEVLLVSLRAGGVGLNLTAGRRVYLMEPFWNPAVENQAVDRIYRLGQTKSVQTVRFVMDKTIESNMLKIQKRKMELANMSVGRTMTKAELKAQREEEVRILMGMSD
ncbi:hypothetical protein JCM11251_007888 [Rhodosporidiobolus azoricus]